MNADPSKSRIREAGVDVDRIARTAVLVKTGDVSAKDLLSHPVWPLCRGLCAVGFGSVHLCGAIEFFDELAALLPATQFSQQPGMWFEESVAHSASRADIVIDVSNDLKSEQMSTRLAALWQSQLFALGWGCTWLRMICSASPESGYWPTNEEPSGSTKPISPIARIVAGLALQETLIVAGAVDGASSPAPVISHDILREPKQSEEDKRAWRNVRFANVIVDVVGVGGIGVNFVEAFTPLLGSGCQLRLFDPDIVGSENLSSQIAFTDQDIGKPKVLAMAERLVTLCDPTLVIRPFAVSYEDRPRRLATPSLLVTCTDTWESRAYACDRSVRDRLPMVDAGSSPLAAQVRTYVPGQSCCLRHRYPELTDWVAKEQIPASCGTNHAMTLPGTNMICGGLLSLEVARALRSDSLRAPATGEITYDTRFPRRIAETNRRMPCEHPDPRGLRRMVDGQHNQQG